MVLFAAVGEAIVGAAAGAAVATVSMGPSARNTRPALLSGQERVTVDAAAAAVAVVGDCGTSAVFDERGIQQ